MFTYYLKYDGNGRLIWNIKKPIQWANNNQQEQLIKQAACAGLFKNCTDERTTYFSKGIGPCGKTIKLTETEPGESYKQPSEAFLWTDKRIQVSGNALICGREGTDENGANDTD